MSYDARCDECRGIGVECPSGYQVEIHRCASCAISYVATRAACERMQAAPLTCTRCGAWLNWIEDVAKTDNPNGRTPPP